MTEETGKALAYVIDVGVRVSGEIQNQSFTGTVSSIGSRGGRYEMLADLTITTTLDPGVIESVSVNTDQPLTTAAGRTLYGAHLTGPALESLRVLEDRAPLPEQAAPRA